MDYPPEITSGVSVMLWIGFGGMVSGAFTFLIFKCWKKEGRDIFYSLTFLSCAIAALSYLCMALDMGQVVVGVNRRVYWSRYLDWCVTTPILLANLLLLNQNFKVSSLVHIIGADVLMFVSGLASAFVISELRFGFWGFAVIMFFVVLAEVFQQLRSVIDYHSDVAALFKVLASMVAFCWTMYPIVWILSNAGLHLMPFILEVGILTVTDLITKVVFGLILLTNRAVLEEPEPSETKSLINKEFS